MSFSYRYKARIKRYIQHTLIIHTLCQSPLIRQYLVGDSEHRVRASVCPKALWEGAMSADEAYVTHSDCDCVIQSCPPARTGPFSERRVSIVFKIQYCGEQGITKRTDSTLITLLSYFFMTKNKNVLQNMLPHKQTGVAEVCGETYSKNEIKRQ